MALMLSTVFWILEGYRKLYAVLTHLGTSSVCRHERFLTTSTADAQPSGPEDVPLENVDRIVGAFFARLPHGSGERLLLVFDSDRDRLIETPTTGSLALLMAIIVPYFVG